MFFTHKLLLKHPSLFLACAVVISRGLYSSQEDACVFYYLSTFLGIAEGHSYVHFSRTESIYCVKILSEEKELYSVLIYIFNVEC